MTQEEIRSRLMSVVALSSGYCSELENARESEKREFVINVLRYLPRIYAEFSDSELAETNVLESGYFASYVDEDYYESIRRNVESLLGEDDIFLETFEQDMKYSDSPVAASISESLADIFQVLYNFISEVNDTDGEHVEIAYSDCRENFEAYWSQTLCNVMRALNHLRYEGNLD